MKSHLKSSANISSPIFRRYFDGGWPSFTVDSPSNFVTSCDAIRLNSTVSVVLCRAALRFATSVAPFRGRLGE